MVSVSVVPSLVVAVPLLVASASAAADGAVARRLAVEVAASGLSSAASVLAAPSSWVAVLAVLA